jgi:hypothetical protein
MPRYTAAKAAESFTWAIAEVEPVTCCERQDMGQEFFGIAGGLM